MSGGMSSSVDAEILAAADQTISLKECAFLGEKNCGCTKYKTVPNNYRLFIDRSCLYFKRTYALRTECERYNSRFKSTGQERL